LVCRRTPIPVSVADAVDGRRARYDFEGLTSVA